MSNGTYAGRTYAGLPGANAAPPEFRVSTQAPASALDTSEPSPALASILSLAIATTGFTSGAYGSPTYGGGSYAGRSPKESLQVTVSTGVDGR